MVDCILDGWQGTINSLRVGDLLVGIKRNIEIDLRSCISWRCKIANCVETGRTATYPYQHTLVLEVDISDRKLV